MNKNNTGLIIIDVQGRLAEIMHQGQAVINQIKILIQAAQIFDLPIVWMEQLPEKLGKTTPQLAELLEGDAYEKSTFSGWKTAGIAQAIQQAGCENWLIVGIEAHVCVYQTVKDLLENGYKTHLVTDAIASRVLPNKELAIQKMQQLGSEITSVEMALFELQQIAEGAEFKSMIQLLK